MFHSWDLLCHDGYTHAPPQWSVMSILRKLKVSGFIQILMCPWCLATQYACYLIVKHHVNFKHIYFISIQIEYIIVGWKKIILIYLSKELIQWIKTKKYIMEQKPTQISNIKLIKNIVMKRIILDKINNTVMKTYIKFLKWKRKQSENNPMET